MKHLAYKPKKISRSMTTGICVGVGLALLVSILLTTGLTSLVIRGKISEDKSCIFVFVIRTISVALGGIAAITIYLEKNLPVIGFTAVGYLLIIQGLGIILYDGSFHNFWSGVISALMGGLVTWGISLKSKRKSKYLKRITK